MLEEIGRQSGDLVLGNRTAKDPLHFCDDGLPLFFGMFGLHINVIGRVANQAIGVGNLLSLTRLKGKGIGRQGN